MAFNRTCYRVGQHFSAIVMLACFLYAVASVFVISFYDSIKERGQP